MERTRLEGEVPATEVPEKPWAINGAAGRPKNYINSFAMDPANYRPRVELLRQKLEKIRQNEFRFEGINLDDAELVIVAYGSAFRSAMTAMVAAHEEGLKVGIFRPITLFPFPTKPLSDLSGNGRSFLVAELSLGQLIEDVRLSIDSGSRVELVNQFSGVPISSDEILEAVEKMMK